MAELSPGDPAPDFQLKDAEGQTRTLADFAGQWVVLYFYPKDDTPGCTTEACAFRDSQSTYDDLNAAIVGVSPDDTDSHAKFADKYDLPFILLADTDKEACEAYGVWQEKKNYGRTYMGVQRSTFLIDPDGKIARVWDKVKVKEHDDQVQEALQAAAGD